MKKILEQKEFEILLFCFGMILFDFPFLLSPELNRPIIIFIYLFLAWAAIIFFLFFMSLSQRSTDLQKENGKE